MADRRRKKRKKSRIRISTAGIAWTVLVLMLLTVYGVWAYQMTGTVFPTAELLDGRANFYFIDVGQGDCTLVTHRGDGILIDAGGERTGKRAAEYVFLHSPTVEYFIITHPHEDHMGGAAEILRTVRVECLVLPREVSGDDFYTEALAEAQKRGVEIVYADEGITLKTEHLHAEIFDTSALETDDLNERSMVARVSADGCSVLVTGDAEVLAETWLLENCAEDLDSDLLKVGHHGSSTSTGEAFLNAVSPMTAVISCGRNNTYGHPAREVTQRILESGVELRRTDYEGTVVIRTGVPMSEWAQQLFDRFQSAIKRSFP